MGIAVLKVLRSDEAPTGFSMRLERLERPRRPEATRTPRSGGASVLHLAGELDIVWAERVRAAIGALAGEGLVVDVSGLRFIDATGVGAVVAGERAAAKSGHRLVVRGASGIVRRVFEVSGLASLLEPAT